MASSGLVLLLLVLSSFLISSMSVSQPSDQQETRSLQKRGEKLEKTKTAGKYFLKFLTALKPFIGLIPGAGEYLNLLIDLANVAAGASSQKQVVDFLKKEFQSLNFKIDENQKQLEWNIWASGQYAKLETKINISWNKLQELLNNCAEPCAESLKKGGKDKKIKNYFLEAEKYVDTLHSYIVGKGAYSPEFEKLLKDHVRCHEKSIKIYSAVNAGLMYKAITITHFYDRFNNIATNEDNLANKAHDISAAMFQIHKKCISDPDPYVKLDVVDRTKESVKREELAENIRKYLDSTYNRYNWMVVAFLTGHSNHKNIFTKWRNRHILTGFTVAEIGKTSVAVAKQAKGTHKKTVKVINAIKECYDKTVACDKVKAKLENCAKEVDGIKVKDTYSAIHAYIHKKHDSAHALEAEEAPTEEYLDPEAQYNIPYIYTGKCNILKGIDNGRFRVLIKSDEEWMKVDPCKDVKCGGEKRGKCVPLKNAHIGLCECKKGYYGESCEENIKDYKKSFFSKKSQKPKKNMKP
ncbi:hypothetical protein CRENBAI_015462 [Crenichthys baileyi]|uniref:EGF-like domain-containing protein n=1 Tax=Crenichthys baileyi TaxID=28760 RepID=A0AAV9RRB2_9TELE